MSLTLALVLAGALLLVALLAHSAWQVRRLRPPPGAAAADEPAGASIDERAFTAERIEPTLEGGALGSAAAAGGAPGAPIAPAEGAGDSPDAPAFAAPPRKVAHVAAIDALVDAIATLKVDSPVAGEGVLAHLPGSRRAGSKPFAIEGLGSETGTWEPVQPARSYSELQAGIQLANRSGPLNEIEYSEFVQKLEALAEPLGALLEVPDMLDVVARARELDAFATENDAQLAMRLRPQGSAWSTGYVLQQATRCGFVPGALPGRLVLPGAVDSEPPVLVLNFDAQAALSELPSQAVVRELSLEFDVAQTAREAEPYQVWLESGRALAESLEALVTDNQGQPMQITALDGTERELAQLYDRLEEHGLPAGSAAARRLFS